MKKTSIPLKNIKFFSDFTEINAKIVAQYSVPVRQTQVSWISTNLVSTERQWNSDHKKSKICVKSLKYGSNLSKNYGF